MLMNICLKLLYTNQLHTAAPIASVADDAARRALEVYVTAFTPEERHEAARKEALVKCHVATIVLVSRWSEERHEAARKR